MSKRRLSPEKYNYEDNSKLHLDLYALKRENKSKNIAKIKSLESYIYLNELLNLYLIAFNDPTNEKLKSNVIIKIKEKNNCDWRNIIKFKRWRSNYLKEKYNIDEDKLINDLQGIQTGDVIPLDVLPENLKKYLRREYLSSISKVTKTKKQMLSYSGNKSNNARGKRTRIKKRKKN